MEYGRNSIIAAEKEVARIERAAATFGIREIEIKIRSAIFARSCKGLLWEIFRFARIFGMAIESLKIEQGEGSARESRQVEISLILRFPREFDGTPARTIGD